MKDIKTLNLDVRESNDQYISAVQFDSNSRTLRVCITSNGEALNITGHSVILSGIKPDGYDIFNECVIVDAPKGLVDVVLSQQVLARNGVLECQLKIIGADNSILSTQDFQIHVNKSAMRVTVTSSNEYDALIKALAKVQSVDNKAEKSEVEKLSAQLDTIKKEISSVFIFDYDRTGKKDESINLQNTINSIRNDVINNKLSNNIKFIIKGGILRLNNKVTFPPFIHIHADGLLIINSYVSGESTIHITNDESDISFSEISERQGYLKGSLISSTDGIILKCKLSNRNNSVGLEIGSRTNLGTSRPISRYNIDSVLIEGFDVGLKMNRFNHYIGSFNKCSFEINKTNIYFGDSTGSSATNSGENFSFFNCIFSTSDICLNYNVDGFDCNFFGCSFDYNKVLIKTKKGYKKVSLFGCHIEDNKCILDASENTQPFFSLHLNNCLMFIYHGNMFKGNAFVTINNLKALMTTIDYTKGLYLCDENIIVCERDTFIQGDYNFLTSRNLNIINNDRFDNLTVDGTTVINDLKEYKFRYGEITGFKVTDIFPENSSFTKVLKIESTKTGNWITIKSIDFDCSPSDVISSGITLYAENMTKLPNCEIKLIFKDKLGNVISETTGYLPKNTGDVNKWLSLITMRNVIAPKASATVCISATIAAIEVGQNVYIGEISLCKQ